ncbi:MAG TPA: phytanoyl-CoA dioxygenase family protein [Caulobacteraceae bacterium]|jgi:ectoine hydroxylase-related dioxygenase (phytanoyl-CoA dioxygenase family)
MRHERPVAGAPSAEEFDLLMATKGWAAFPRVLGDGALRALRADAERVYALRREVQLRNGVAEGMDGAAHHVLGEDSSLDAFIADLPLYGQIERHFGGRVILLNFGAALHPPGARSYTFKPHRDVRAFTRDYRLSLNMLVMLDDFTVENGATLVLDGSHRIEEMPEPTLFQQHAGQLVGRAGDIVLFDSLLVHSAAPNRSHAPRRALTLCFGRPFMKPQMDWPRYLPTDAESRLSPCARQLLGYDARVAATLDEYYQPPERWTFKADQR